MIELETFAARVLLEPSLSAKLKPSGPVSDRLPGEPRTVDEPARPDRLKLRSDRPPPAFPTAGRLHEPLARAQALHTFANHELLALELMALTLLRFPDAPRGYRLSLAATMADEQRHLRLYLERMSELGVTFGDFGVSAFFWDALAEVSSPAAFAAAMGMTLEQANLDFSGHFFRAFEAVGDHRSAAILREIHDDEVGHLRQGRRWFDKLSDVPMDEADATLYERWADALEPPMTPARGRGIDFDADGRRRAGLPEPFVERVALARHSRGRPPVVYWMNPACELRMGHPGPLPQAALTMERELETLPVAWAKADDVALVRRLPSLSLQRRWVEAGLEVPQWQVYDDDGVEGLGDRALADLRPWTWDTAADALLADLCQRVQHPKAQVNHLLDSGAARRHDLHRKDHWVPLAQTLCEPGTRPTVCCDVESVERLLREQPAQVMIAKAPFGSAGRGAIRVPPRERGATLTSSEERWVARTLRRQGAVVLGPWLPRLVDLSGLLAVDPDGHVKDLGVTRFFTDPRGQYLGTVLGDATVGLPTEARRYWHGGGDRQRSVRRRMSGVTAQVGEELRRRGFCGVAGVDALIWRGDDLKLMPLLEVNPRRTMGHVGQDLERRMSAGHSGLLLMLGRPALRQLGCESLAQAVDTLRSRVGDIKRDAAGRLAQGVVPLADPSAATLSLPLWLVTSKADALMTATADLGLPWSGACASPFEQLPPRS